MKKIKLVSVTVLLFVISHLIAATTSLKLQIKGSDKSKISLLNSALGKHNNIFNQTIEIKKTNGLVSIQKEMTEPLLIDVNFYFYVFLEPGDQLQITADVTKPYAGIKYTFTGKGAQNNKLYQQFMAIYYRYFPVPIEGLWNQKLQTSDIISKYDAAIAEMNLWLEKNKSFIHPALYNYLYSYTHISLPVSLIRTAKFNSYDVTTGFEKYQPRIDQLTLYPQGFYDINFRIQILNSVEYLVSTQTANSTITPDQKFALVYSKMKSIVANNDKELQKSLLHYTLQYGLNNSSNSNIEPMLAQINDFQAMFPNDKDGNELMNNYKLKLKLSIGKTPPAIHLTTLDGKKFDFEQLKGKVVYVDFWASWCAPCRSQMKTGAKILHEKFKNADVVFLYISLDDKAENWRKAIAEDNIQGIHLLDEKKQVSVDYNIISLPTYMIIGKDGKIKQTNAPKPSDKATEDLLNVYLKE